MDDSAQSIYSPKKPTLLKVVFFITLEISASVILILIILIALNNFNILSLKNVPIVSNFLKAPSAPAPTLGTIDPKLRKTLPFLSCPLRNCAGGTVIKNASSAAYAIQFENIASDSSIYAAIGGKFKKISATSFTIENSERGILVKYEIVANEIKMPENLTNVSDKDLVITLGKGPNSLDLSATATRTKQSLQLGIYKDGKYLTNIE